MAGHTHLSLQLEEAGVDMDLINQVMKLKEIENLVKDGKVTKEVYDKLVDDVLRQRIDTNNTSVREGHPKSKSKSNNMMAKLTKVVLGSRRKKPKKTKPSSRNAAIIKEKERKDSSQYQKLELEPMEPEIIPQRASVERRTLLEDDLMRLGQDKNGNAKWRKVKVTLYDDSLEYYIKSKKGEVRNKKVIMLSDDFFVNAEINKQQLSKIYSNAHNNTNSSFNTDDVFGQPHLFLLSDLDEHYYFAAEDEVKKEFWVSMLVQTIRDITENMKPRLSVMKGSPGNVSKSKRYVFKYETLKKNYYQQKIRKTMRIGKLEDFKEENFLKEEAKWKKQGTQLARQSIAVDFKRQEMERAKEALEQQEILKKQLADKERALEQITKKFQENEQEWQRKYDDLLAEKRAEAKKRNEEREKERAALEKEIEAMQRKQAVTFRATSMTNLSLDQQKMMEEYENQLQQYKAKLSALESALNVDVSSLDWDGTLEDAEKKMQALVEDLMSADDEVRRDAQAKFDQWDHIVRNHADFKNREVKKWETWENENAEKNRDALNEMRTKYVPEKFLSGISQKELIEKTGIPKKTARRIMQNRIFKFFYMDKDRIAKIHIADLLNNYASQGLDIRELRAVYACLPDEFQNDADGKKKEFRDNLRARLSMLTKKEKEGKLTANEKMHNAYRDKEIKAVRKIAGGKPSGPRVKKNHNFQNKALALQAMLQGRGGDGPPKLPFGNKPKAIQVSSKPAAAEAVEKPGKLDPKAAEWQTYFRMKKQGLPDGAIMNRMQKDGKDPSLWNELQSLNEKSTRSLATDVPASERSRTGSFFDNPTLGPKLTPEPVQSAAPLAAIQQRAQAMSEKLRREDKGALKKKKSESLKIKKRRSEKGKKSRGSKGPKQTLRKRSQRNRSSVKNPNEAGVLIDKAHLDYALEEGKKQVKGGADLNLEYGKKAKTGKNNMKSVIDAGIQELIDIILEEGEYDAAEGGQKTMKFGELSDRYESISDMLVGLLLKAKRQKLVKYRGDMLFKGIHDEIKITVK